MSRIILLIIGIALIVFGFLTLVETDSWTKQIWLDLVVAIFVFVLNYSNFAFIGQSKKDFRARIPSIGILWTYLTLYSVLSIGALILAHLSDWSFSFSFFIQLVLAFGVLVAFFLAFAANQHALEVQHAESTALSSLDQLREVYSGGVGIATRFTHSQPDISKAITKIGDDLRYLSAICGAEAQQLDTETKTEIQHLFGLLGRTNAEDLSLQKPEIDKSLERIQELLRQRKNCKNNSDHKEMFS